jgi:hypothetical protein
MRGVGVERWIRKGEREKGRWKIKERREGIEENGRRNRRKG